MDKKELEKKIAKLLIIKTRYGSLALRIKIGGFFAILIAIFLSKEKSNLNWFILIFILTFWFLEAVARAFEEYTENVLKNVKAYLEGRKDALNKKPQIWKIIFKHFTDLYVSLPYGVLLSIFFLLFSHYYLAFLFAFLFTVIIYIHFKL